MSFWNKLENLRNKSEPARQAMALFLAIAITAVIVGIWLYLKTIPKISVNAGTKTPPPFQMLWNYLTDFWK